MTPSTDLHRRAGRRFAALAFTFSFLFLTTLASLPAAPMKFSIPAQSGPDAVRLFIKQSGVQVLFNAAEIKETKTNEVNGEFEPAAALDRLFAGTGHAAQPSGTTGFVITST